MSTSTRRGRLTPIHRCGVDSGLMVISWFTTKDLPRMSSCRYVRFSLGPCSILRSFSASSFQWLTSITSPSLVLQKTLSLMCTFIALTFGPRTSFLYYHTPSLSWYAVCTHTPKSLLARVRGRDLFGVYIQSVACSKIQRRIESRGTRTRLGPSGKYDESAISLREVYLLLCTMSPLG